MQRHIKQTLQGIPTQDGAGVQLTRIIGSPQLNMLDPFLLLDCFASDQPDDYIAGFPQHPHRGFETVTYLLNGKMRHQDTAGNEGVIESGGVQWMTAGRGIEHSEMPEQEHGLLKGFQLWVNLPAKDKMTAPAYQEYAAQDIPIETSDNGTIVRVIAGQTQAGTTGPVVNNYTSPTYLDIGLSANTTWQQTLVADYNAFIYVIEGAVTIAGKTLATNDLGVLSEGEEITLVSAETDSRCLLIAGEPLQEPVARGGPFVMNTQEEIMQAFADYRHGRLIS